MPDGYDIAQICLNGHLINSTYIHLPEHNSNYCGECGDQTIHQCPNCNRPIRGHLWCNVISMSDINVPKCCLECGHAFPWTERKKRAAFELFAEEISDQEELKKIQDSLDSIAANAPDAQLAWYRIDKQIGKLPLPLQKIGKELTKALGTEVVVRSILGS